MANSTNKDTPPIYLTYGTTELTPLPTNYCKLNSISFQEYLLGGSIQIAAFNGLDTVKAPSEPLNCTLEILHMTIPKGMARINYLGGSIIDPGGTSRDLISLMPEKNIKTGITLIANDIKLLASGAQTPSFDNHIKDHEEPVGLMDIGIETPCAKFLTTFAPEGIKGELIFTRWKSDLIDQNNIEERENGLWYFEGRDRQTTKDFYTLGIFGESKTAFDYDYVVATMPNHVVCYIALIPGVEYDFLSPDEGTDYPIIAIEKLIYLDGPDIFIGTPKL